MNKTGMNPSTTKQSDIVCNCCCHVTRFHPEMEHQHKDCEHCVPQQPTVSHPEPEQRTIDQLPESHQEKIREVKAKFTHDQLLQALYWVEDFMNRSLINFFVIGPTADSVKGQKHLTGDAIYIGVRRVEWESEPASEEGHPGIPSGGRRLVDAVVPYAEDEGDIVYYYSSNDVPVILFVFEDEPTVTSLDQVNYEREFWKIPNPYQSFKEQYDILWI